MIGLWILLNVNIWKVLKSSTLIQTFPNQAFSFNLSTLQRCLKMCQNKSNFSHLFEFSNRVYITSYPKIFENTRYAIPFA